MKQAVLGLGFGDEGKGITTSFLCQGKQPYETIIVRSNGGHQAGHTVQHNGHRHIFSQFGSGTLQGFPTYFSKYCTIYPPSLLREYSLLERFKPKLFIDPLTMITTPWDIDANRQDENSRAVGHGSVGMGFGRTIQRNEDYYKLYFQDLFNKEILLAKLKSIVYGYYGLDSTDVNVKADILDFLDKCDTLTNSSFCKMRKWEYFQGFNVIFESAQGIMLDQDFGFFPNVTRSNTTSKNIIELAPDLEEIYYVTRTYQTRHGNGYMSNEDKPAPKLDMRNGGETNQSHNYQGEFRISQIDPDQLNYALFCDSHFVPNGVRKNLVITCYDQHPIDLTSLLDKLGEVVEFDKVFISNSPDAKDFKEIKK